MKIELYSDSSSSPGKFFSVAAWIALVNGKKIAQGYRRCIGMNQTGGEIMAARDALVWAHEQKHTAISIYPDCLNVSRALNGAIDVYADRNWKIKYQRSKKNMKSIKKRGLNLTRRDMFDKEAWQLLYEIYLEVKPILICERVPAHSGNFWNDQVDRLAKRQFREWEKSGFAR